MIKSLLIKEVQTFLPLDVDFINENIEYFRSKQCLGVEYSVTEIHTRDIPILVLSTA